MKPKILLSWSSGKDCAWTLHVLRQQQQVDVVGLLATYNEAFDRVAMHGVRLDLVRAQAESSGLPLWPVPLPWPCSNDIYESRMAVVIGRARSEGIEQMAFGDLFLADVRAYRERQLMGTGIQPIFPLWGTVNDTPSLARQMIDAGLRATLVCVDPKQLDPSFVGREFDIGLLANLPSTVDPCGERGEFHTFCHSGPMFQRAILFDNGDIVERDGFWFADLQSRPSLANGSE